MVDWGKLIQIDSKSDGLITARVIGVNREIYQLGVVGRSKAVRGELSGRLRFASESGELPVVGDWVRCADQGDFLLIVDVLPRKTILSRKTAGIRTEEQPLAANVDVVAIVQGLDGGRNFSLRGMERYLTLAWDSGATPLIILNKADLCEEGEAFRNEAELAAPGVDILITSAVEGKGLEEVKKKLKGRTAVLIGPSGVGKSALTNALLGEESRETGAIREGDKRGRHTTTSSRLFPLSSGGWLIDSPGLKEVQLWGEEESVDDTFSEIREWAEKCRFKDCTHQGEPGCAVQEALRDGLIDPGRYGAYLDLRREMSWLESRRSEKYHLEERKKGKTLSKHIRSMKSDKSIY
ncbi:MAG: ribosome small subunit-dependent GTPase A [Spirochaetales bacterium]|nr:ribosome small subunit-dependent GTPase A [Spirochaetales bacterium]